MTPYFSRLVLLVYIVFPNRLHGFFPTQESLNILCYQFPLISTLNNSNIQCAQLLKPSKTNILSAIDQSTQIVLFMLFDLPPPISSHSPPVDITINITWPSYPISAVSKIRLAVLSPILKTVNSEPGRVYSSQDLPVFVWHNSTNNMFELVDVIDTRDQAYTSDSTLCQWNIERWDRILNRNMTSSDSYVYFVKTTDSNITFTLMDEQDQSTLPSAYLNILHCFPYRIQAIEISIITVLCVLFIGGIGFWILMYLLKREDDEVRLFSSTNRRNAPSEERDSWPENVRHHSTTENPYDQQ